MYSFIKMTRCRGSGEDSKNIGEIKSKTKERGIMVTEY
jgi:hypothetical protein